MRYYYKGKEITKTKVNLMVIGAMLGMVGMALGTWALAVLAVGLGG